jgi:predicted DsbA family dithiol-disulfide isomerase
MKSQHLTIDFVSDIACPWCAIGLGALEQALAHLSAGTHPISATIHFQPFQLNPDMPPEGQDIGEHLTGKYGTTVAQQEQAYAMIRDRGAAVGFDFRLGGRGRTWNTLACHRLLHWASLLEDSRAGLRLQHRMKKEMLKAYFTDGLNPGSTEVLLDIVRRLGLDEHEAESILTTDRYTDEVRAQQAVFRDQGIHAVPAVIVNQQYLISGGQPTEVFEASLKRIAEAMTST